MTNTMRWMRLALVLSVPLSVLLSSAEARADGPAPGAAPAAAAPAPDAAAKPKPPSTEEVLVADLASAKWAPAPTPGLPKGTMGAPIGLDPNTKGPTGYAKIPAGAHVPAHWHSHAEYTAVLSGKAVFVVDGKKHDVSPGSYMVIPAKVHHELTCDAGAECILLTRRGGPPDYNFITPP